MAYKQDRESSPRGGRTSHVLNSKYRGSLWFPAWDKAKFIPTVFMPFGVPTPDLRGYLPWRTAPGAQEYGDWIKAVPIFKGGSYNRTTLIAGYVDPVSGAWSQDKTPVHRLLDTFRKMKNMPGKEHWLALDKGGDGKSPAIDGIKTTAVMQGAILEHNGKSYLDAPKFPSVLGLPYSAAQSLEELLDLETEGYAGNPMDFNQRYAVGDLLNPDGAGKLIRIYNSKTDPTQAGQGAQGYRAQWNKPQTGVGGKKSNVELAHYKVELLPNPNAHPRDPQTGQIWFDQQGFGFQPWDKVLNVGMTDEQMVAILCDAFEDVPDLLQLAFGEVGLLPPGWYEKQEKAHASKMRSTEMAARAQAVRTAATAGSVQPVQPAWQPPVAGQPATQDNIPYTFPPNPGAGMPQQPPPAYQPPAPTTMTQPAPVQQSGATVMPPPGSPVIAQPQQMPQQPPAQRPSGPAPAWGNGGPGSATEEEHTQQRGPGAFAPQGASAVFPPAGDPGMSRTAAAMAALRAKREQLAAAQGQPQPQQ